ncbi:MAG: hypothetical protein B6244_11630 [Candidatus Cloacimonetes bacterium 4572_55]|nr:MAG: hypothetical protein B6244_11630 [Candidatus Cloacimonetes bacterium 4572_55]
MLMKNSMESKNLFLPKTVKNFRFIVITALCLFMIGLLFPYRIYAQYSHGESVFGNGGVEKSSNDDYQVIGTVGQTNIGITSDQNNENDVGFWYGIPYCENPPIAAMEFSSDYICEGDSILFEDFSTNHCGVLFDDGISGNQLGYATYPDAGIYLVRLIALGCGVCPNDTIEVEITVCALPQPDFSIIMPDSCAPAMLYFINETLLPPPCAELEFLWDFGDNNTTTDPGYNSLQHTYDLHGTYQVCLTVSVPGLNDCLAVVCQTVTVDSCTTECDIPSVLITSARAIRSCSRIFRPITVEFYLTTVLAEINWAMRRIRTPEHTLFG